MVDEKSISLIVENVLSEMGIGNKKPQKKQLGVFDTMTEALEAVEKAYALLAEAGKIAAHYGAVRFSASYNRTAEENVNNIETVHLHFGMQLVFDESQKECNSEIWIPCGCC